MRRTLIAFMTAVSLLICMATFVLWAHDRSNLHRGRPVVTLYSWGDENVATECTILLGLGRVYLSSSWGYRPLPPGPGIQHIYMTDKTFDVMGFSFHKSTTRPEGPNGQVLEGVHGHDSSLALSLRWPLLLSAILPVRLIALLYLRFARRRERRIAEGMCPPCAYN